MTESDDERARARATILQRRARLVAYAVATGVVTAACSGRTTCLEPPSRGNAGNGGTPVTSGGTGFCLSVAAGSSMGGTITVACLSIAAGTGGTPISVCLEPVVGGAGSDAAAGAGGEPDAGGAGGENSAGTGGAQPFGGSSGCLVPPA